MHRMMQSSGTAEGLRGLIDSSILKSLKKIIEWRGLFGSSVFPIGKLSPFNLPPSPLHLCTDLERMDE